MHRSSPPLWALGVFVLLLSTPVADASGLLVDPLPVRFEYTVPSEADEASRSFFFVFGAASFEERTVGSVLFQGDRGSSLRAEVIRVYDATDPLAMQEGRPVLVADRGELVPDAGAAALWSPPELAVKGHAEFTTALLLDVENGLPDHPLIIKHEGPAPPNLVVDGRDGSFRFRGTGDPQAGYLPLEGGFTVRGPEGEERHFDGSDHVARFEGTQEVTLQADAIAVPTDGGFVADFARAGDDVFTERFSAERLGSFVQGIQALASRLQGPGAMPGGEDRFAMARQGDQPSEGSEPEAADDGPPETASPLPEELIASLGSVLNGALVGTPSGELDVLGATLPADGGTGLSVLRFDTLSFDAFSPGAVGGEAESPFLYAGGVSHHDVALVQAGPLLLPYLSIVLFLVGVGAFVAARRRFGRDLELDEAARAREARFLPGVIALRFGGPVVALLLFDRELFLVYGESVLATLGLWGGTGYAVSALATVALVQAAVMAYAAVLYGLPMTLLLKGGMRFAGLSRAMDGAAEGLAALVAFLLGVSLIRPVLGVLLGAVAGAAQA